MNHQNPRRRRPPPDGKRPPPPRPPPPDRHLHRTNSNTRSDRPRQPLPPPPPSQQAPPPMFPRTPEEIPPQYRRTLILSRIPPHLTYRDIRHHFTVRHDAAVDFCTVDRHAAEAYVKFRERSDVMRIWEGGDAGLDGSGYGGTEGEVSLVAAGVKLKAIHFTNQVARMGKAREEGGGQLERKRSWDGSRRRQEEEGGRRSLGSRFSQQRDFGAGAPSPNKMSRRSEDHYATPTAPASNTHEEEYDSRQYSTPGVQVSSHASAPSHPSNRDRLTDKSAPNYSDPTGTIRHSTPQNDGHLLPNEAVHQETHQQPPPIQIHSVSQQTKPLAWNRTPNRSTLEQKLALLQKQEMALQKQLHLQKKMLAVLQSKNHPKDDQTKKLKEILSLQTRVMELKKERMEGMKELDGARGRSGLEKKTMGWSGRRSLDRRTTVLRVDGLDGVEKKDEAVEESIKEHFSMFGSVISVSVECIETDETTSRFALVKFANRSDAERAKSSDEKFNTMSVTCSWHNPPPSSALPSTHSTTEKRQDETNPNGDALEINDDGVDHDIYNDVYDDAYEGEEGGIPSPYAEERHHDIAEYYDEDDEHDMVDYD